MSLRDFGLEVEYSVKPPNFKANERAHIIAETKRFLAKGKQVVHLELGDSVYKGLTVEDIKCKVGFKPLAFGYKEPHEYGYTNKENVQ